MEPETTLFETPFRMESKTTAPTFLTTNTFLIGFRSKSIRNVKIYIAKCSYVASEIWRQSGYAFKRKHETDPNRDKQINAERVELRLSSFKKKKKKHI